MGPDGVMLARRRGRVPSSGRLRQPHGVPLSVGAALLVLLAASCSPVVPTTTPATVPASGQPPSASASPAGTPLSSGLVVLTSPPPQPPDGLADPSTPAYDPSTGFTPDAVRVLTVLSIQVALEGYREGRGAYPDALAALFPDFAPIGPDHQPMTGPPAASDGYAYTLDASTSYTLSVVLESGQAYVVHAPGGP